MRKPKPIWTIMVSLVLISGIFALSVPSQDAYATVISDCKGDSSFDGETLMLNGTISNFGGNPCIEIAHDDVVLDCHGFTIDGINSPSSIGVLITGDNVTIKNCTITDFDKGILLNDSDNGRIYHNKFYVNNYGIKIENQSNENIIRSNQAANNTQSALHIDTSSSTNSITRNNFSFTFAGAGISIFSNGNTVQTNKINNNQFGILLNGTASFNQLFKNMANQNFVDGINLCFDCQSNNLKKNTTIGNSDDGIDDNTGTNSTNVINSYKKNFCDGNGNSGSEPTGLCRPQP